MVSTQQMPVVAVVFQKVSCFQPEVIDDLGCILGVPPAPQAGPPFVSQALGPSYRPLSMCLLGVTFQRVSFKGPCNDTCFPDFYLEKLCGPQNQ